MTILDQAKAIFEERQATYNSPKQNFTDIATGWSVILNTPVNAHQVAQMMIWMKTCREKSNHKEDNLLDQIGYVIADSTIYEAESSIKEVEEELKDAEFKVAESGIMYAAKGTFQDATRQS